MYPMYPSRTLALSRFPKSQGGDDECTDGTADCHDKGRRPETDGSQEEESMAFTIEMRLWMILGD